MKTSTNTSPKAIEVNSHQLPAYCPNPQMNAWSSHPKVFIVLSEGAGRCPYCGTVYILKPGANLSHS